MSTASDPNRGITIGGASASVEPPSISMLNNVREHANELNGTIDQLEARLSFVLSPIQPSPPDAEQDASADISPMTLELAGLLRNIGTAIAKINGLHQRLEV